MRASIIVPVKDNLDVTEVCIDSLKKYSGECEIIIVNDGSSAKVTKALLGKIDGIKYLENPKSVGWCKAINQGIKVATGDFVVLANNDIVATPKWLDRMLEHFKRNSKLGVLGPITNQVAGYQHIDYNKEGITFQATDVVTFFFVMIKREVIKKTGGLDERFGLGGQDDADYCIRTREAGFEVGIARDVFIYHYGSATFRKEFKNDAPKSSEYAESRIDLLRDKHRGKFDTGVRKRIFIAIPNGGKIVSELAVRLVAWSHDPRFAIRLYLPKNVFPLDAARNHCVAKFLETDCDYLLWIDDDIVPPPTALDTLLKADKDIIGAVCFAMKYENGMGFPYPVTLKYNEDKQYVVYYGKGVEEVDATGGAFVLFKRKVYETIERPYAFQYYRNGTLALTCDFDVFQKAQRAGLKLFIDFDVICDHIRTASLKSFQDLLVMEGAK